MKWFILLLSISMLLKTIKTEDPPAEETDEAGNEGEEAPAEDAGEEKAEETGEEGEGGDEKTDAGAAPKKETKKTGPKRICNKELVTALGMKGVTDAIEDELEMCPSISFSCCTVKDQLVMYDNWVKVEEPKLTSTLKGQFDVYSALLSEISEVEINAKAMLVKLEKGPENNCKALATRISQLRIKDQGDKLKVHIEEFHRYLLTLHRGVYCAVCDADQQKNFKVDKKEIVLSRNTCREVVGKSLVFLLYFHVHLNKVLNLIAMFVNGCDGNGVFTEKAIPTEFVFEPNGDIEKIVLESRENRNKMDWFKFFKAACDRMNITMFSEFFMPGVKKYEAFTAFIRDLIKTKGAEKQTEELAEKAAAEGKGKEDEEAASTLARLLQQLKEDESKKEDKDLEKDKEELEADLNEAERDKNKIQHQQNTNIYEPFTVYIGSLEAVVPINTFNTIFEDPGLDVYDYGVCSKFEEPIYEKVMNMKDEVPGAAKKEDSGKSAYLTSINTVILALYLIFSQ